MVRASTGQAFRLLLWKNWTLQVRFWPTVAVRPFTKAQPLRNDALGEPSSRYSSQRSCSSCSGRFVASSKLRTRKTVRFCAVVTLSVFTLLLCTAVFCNTFISPNDNYNVYNLEQFNLNPNAPSIGELGGNCQDSGYLTNLYQRKQFGGSDDDDFNRGSLFDAVAFAPASAAGERWHFHGMCQELDFTCPCLWQP